MMRMSGYNLLMSPALVLSEADADNILAALDKGFAAA